MDPGAVGAISDMGPGNIVGVVDSPAQQEHELIEFRIKGPICTGCLPLEYYLQDITEKFALRYIDQQPYSVLVPQQQADDFLHHMKATLQREPGRSRLFRRR